MQSFNTLVIRMVKELTEYSKNKGKMKVTLSEIKINREPTVERMNLRIKSMIWNVRNKRTTNQNNKKKKEFKKNEDSISSLWDNFKKSNIHIIGVPEREEKEQEIGNLFEKIMKGNFPKLASEIHLQV